MKRPSKQSFLAILDIPDLFGIGQGYLQVLSELVLMPPATLPRVERFMKKKFVLQTFHVERRVQLLYHVVRDRHGVKFYRSIRRILSV